MGDAATKGLDSVEGLKNTFGKTVVQGVANTVDIAKQVVSGVTTDTIKGDFKNATSANDVGGKGEKPGVSVDGMKPLDGHENSKPSCPVAEEKPQDFVKPETDKPQMETKPVGPCTHPNVIGGKPICALK